MCFLATKGVTGSFSLRAVCSIFQWLSINLIPRNAIMSCFFQLYKHITFWMCSVFQVLYEIVFNIFRTEWTIYLIRNCQALLCGRSGLVTDFKECTHFLTVLWLSRLEQEEEMRGNERGAVGVKVPEDMVSAGCPPLLPGAGILAPFLPRMGVASLPTRCPRNDHPHLALRAVFCSISSASPQLTLRALRHPPHHPSWNKI